MNGQPTSAAPFNMALDCLQKISDIKVLYRDISIGNAPIFRQINVVDIPLFVQKQKCEIVRQLYLASCPLLTQPQKDKIKPKVDQCNITLREVKDYYGRVVRTQPIVDRGLNTKCDDVVIMISEALQESGFFMPPRKDAGKSITEMG